MLYMAQIERAPAALRDPGQLAHRVTRDYAYFVENRLRARYRHGRRAADHRLQRAPGRRRARSECTATPPDFHEPVRRQRVPVHLRVRHRGPPGQGRRPDLRRRPRRRPARRPVRPRRLRDARQHRPRRRLRRDLDRRPTSTSRRSRARRSARSATSTPTSASTPTPARCSTRSTSSRPTSPRASTRPTRRAPTPPTTTSSTSPAPATRA